MLSCNHVYFRLNFKYSDDDKTHLHTFKTELDNCGQHTMFVGVNTFVFDWHQAGNDSISAVCYIFLAFSGGFIQSDVLLLSIKRSQSDFRTLPVWIPSLLTGSSVPFTLFCLWCSLK